MECNEQQILPSTSQRLKLEKRLLGGGGGEFSKTRQGNNQYHRPRTDEKLWCKFTKNTSVGFKQIVTLNSASR